MMKQAKVYIKSWLLNEGEGDAYSAQLALGLPTECEVSLNEAKPTKKSVEEALYREYKFYPNEFEWEVC